MMLCPALLRKKLRKIVGTKNLPTDGADHAWIWETIKNIKSARLWKKTIIVNLANMWYIISQEMLIPSWQY